MKVKFHRTRQRATCDAGHIVLTPDSLHWAAEPGVWACNADHEFRVRRPRVATVTHRAPQAAA
jgi:hypothetical protein